MKRTVTVLLLVLAAVGCGQDSSSASSASPSAATSTTGASTSASKTDDAVPVNKGKDGTENVALAEAYAKDVCECKDAQCINKAGDKYQQANDKMYADKQIRTPTPEQKKKMDEASARVSECTDKLLKRK